MPQAAPSSPYGRVPRVRPQAASPKLAGDGPVARCLRGCGVKARCLSAMPEPSKGRPDPRVPHSLATWPRGVQASGAWPGPQRRRRAMHAKRPTPPAEGCIGPTSGNFCPACSSRLDGECWSAAGNPREIERPSPNAETILPGAAGIDGAANLGQLPHDIPHSLSRPGAGQSYNEGNTSAV